MFFFNFWKIHVRNKLLQACSLIKLRLSLYRSDSTMIWKMHWALCCCSNVGQSLDTFDNLDFHVYLICRKTWTSWIYSQDYCFLVVSLLLLFRSTSKELRFYGHWLWNMLIWIEIFLMCVVMLQCLCILIVYSIIIWFQRNLLCVRCGLVMNFEPKKKNGLFYFFDFCCVVLCC